MAGEEGQEFEKYEGEMIMAGEEGDKVSFKETYLPFTPYTWIVATLCSLIVLISIIFKRLLHLGSKTLKKKNQKPLFDALQKLKEELMLLGFISLLMTVFQGRLQHICVEESTMHHMLPCKKKTASSTKKLSVDLFTGVLYGGARRLLASGVSDYCQKKVLSRPIWHRIYCNTTNTLS